MPQEVVADKSYSLEEIGRISEITRNQIARLIEATEEWEILDLKYRIETTLQGLGITLDRVVVQGGHNLDEFIKRKLYKLVEFFVTDPPK
ncbi:MAG: hypothetical protein V1936_01775 [Patescibacteria group bacterium]